MATETYAYNSLSDYQMYEAKRTESSMTNSILEDLKAHHSDSYGWALTCCSWDTPMAEDILQEAYLRALDGRAVFSGKSSIKTWFFSVIRLVAVDVYKTQKRHSRLNMKFLDSSPTELSAANEPFEESTLDELAEKDQSSIQLKTALKALPQRQKEVLHLVFYAELTLEESAETLGISLGSARTHYHRGKTSLTTLLESNSGDEK